MTGTCFERQVLGHEHGRHLQTRGRTPPARLPLRLDVERGPVAGRQAAGRCAGTGQLPTPAAGHLLQPRFRGAAGTSEGWEPGENLPEGQRRPALAWAASSMCPKPSGPQFPHLCYCCIVAKSRLTLGHPKDCSPPGSSVDGIAQARILEWVAISSSRGSS